MVVRTTSIKTECLLVNVCRKVERARANVRAVDRAFQARPKVLNSIRGYAAFGIRDHVIHVGMLIIGAKVAIGAERVGVER